MTILEDAQKILLERGAQYGSVNTSFSRIARMWSAYLYCDISPTDVANMMILLKVSRLKNEYSDDTAVDIAGYAQCASEIER